VIKKRQFSENERRPVALTLSGPLEGVTVSLILPRTWKLGVIGVIAVIRVRIATSRQVDANKREFR
jgi:hypothetical protein